MKRLLLVLLIALPLWAEAPKAPKVEDFTRMEQELLDAVAIGDKAPWQNYYAEDAIYSDEAGNIMSKKELVEGIAPLPKGYSGSIKVTKPQMRLLKDTAVILYDADETETIFGQTLKTIFRTTDVWVQRDGKWQIVMTQVMVLHKDPPTVKVDSTTLDRYIGTYELSSDATYTISREGDHLVGQRAGRKPEKLIPEFDFVFFRPGLRGVKIFVRDESGKVTKIIDRRDGNDLVWKRTPR